MSYINTYWLDCVEDLSYDPACIDYEFAKVRWVALIREAYLPTLMQEPGNPVLWTNGIQAGKIVIIPRVSGAFDPGEPAALKGYGKRLYTRGPRTMVLTFSDPSFVRNYSFYSRIHRHTDLVPAFRTSSYLQIADRPADIFGRDEVEEDLEEIVDWDVRCTWRGADLPTLVDASNLDAIVGGGNTGARKLEGWIMENQEAWIGSEEKFVFVNE